eukprot:scaffold4567_cov276-Chaetoceros_neogracile.AAC.22
MAPDSTWTRYDALGSDELASCSLIAEDYGKMTAMLREHLDVNAKIVFGLEGGYQLRDNVPGGNLADAASAGVGESSAGAPFPATAAGPPAFDPRKGFSFR